MDGMMCALCLRQHFLDVESERPEARWCNPLPSFGRYGTI